MSDNPMMGARLTLDLDKTAADNTAKVLQDIHDKTRALTAANNDAAAGYNKANGAAANATKGASNLQKELAALNRAGQFDKLGKDFGTVALQTGNTAKAVADLNAKLKALGATEAEIKKVANAFKNAKDQAQATADAAGNIDDVRADLTGGGDTGGGGLGPGGNRLQQFGSKLRNLPSIQIPGLGIGTDAVANILRVTGALQPMLQKLSGLAVITNLLTPTIGATAAGFLSLTLTALPFVIIMGAMAAAVKSATDSLQADIARVKAELGARRGAVEAAGAGGTTAEATEKIKQYNEAIKTQTKLLDENVKGANDRFAELVKAEESATGPLADLTTRIRTLFNLNDVNTFTAEADKSKEGLADAKAGVKEWTRAIEENLFAIGDTIELLKKEAEERTAATLKAAAAAGQEVAARNRADKATFEQNEARLEAINDEREAIQAQLDVLQASGDTSEEVTAQIAALTGQLGALGKESAYISDTALAASKSRDAEKKAIKDAEKAREEAQRTLEQADKKRLAAGQKYSETLIDIATKAADAAEDALTGLEDKLASNEISFGRDIDKLSRDANRDRLETEIEAQAEEAADLREHQRKLEGIRDDALANEDDALKKRDFLSAARIREETNRKIEAENKAFQDGQSEKQIAEEEARSKEDRELDAARQDRLTALQQQNDDARNAYELRLRDNEVAEERARRDAATNKDRELAAAQELADSVLKIKQLQGDAELQIAGSVLSGIQAMTAGFQAPQSAFNGQGSGNNTTFNANRTIGSLSIPVNGAQNPQQIQQQMLQILGQIGLMPAR